MTNLSYTYFIPYYHHKIKSIKKKFLIGFKKKVLNYETNLLVMHRLMALGIEEQMLEKQKR